MNHLDKHVINYKELQDIIDYAKGQHKHAILPMRMGSNGTILEAHEVNYVLIMDSLVCHLNSLGFLNKLVKFDIKESI